MKKFEAIVFTVFIWLLLTVSTKALSQTVGNGTVFAPAAGAKEAYGINAAQDSGISYPTRHSIGGVGSGIGTSFIGTTSPTSESSPAVSRQSFVADTTKQFHLPKLESIYSGASQNPALQTFNPSMPTMPRSTATVDTWVDPFKLNSFQPLEELPSFNKKRSITDWMKF